MKYVNPYIIGLYLLLSAKPIFADERMSLSEFLARVRAQNLDLKAENAKTLAIKARARGLTVPAPMVGLSQMQVGREDAVTGFEVSQTIPFPTKILQNKKARELTSDSQAKFGQAREVDILSEARLAYFSLWSLQEKVSLLTEKKLILENHIRLSRSIARIDGLSNIHLLKSESDLDLLESEIVSGAQKLRVMQIGLARFLDGDVRQFKIVAEEPPLTSTPSAEKNLEPTYKIQAMSLAVESSRAKESEARAEWYPDFNVRYKETSATAMAPRSRELMFGVSLPFIFFGTPSGLSQAASAERQQLEFELENEKRRVDSDRIILQEKVATLKSQLDLVHKKLLPRAEKRMNLAHNLAPRDMETLQDHRETMEAFPDLKLKALDLRLEYEEALAFLEKYQVGGLP